MFAKTPEVSPADLGTDADEPFTRLVAPVDGQVSEVRVNEGENVDAGTLVAVITANQRVMRVAGLRGHALLFWTLQGVNFGVVVYLFLFGLPGLERWWAVNWMLGLLFLFRIVQNNGLRAKHLRELERAEGPEHQARVDDLLSRLAASREGSEDQA